MSSIIIQTEFLYQSPPNSGSNDGALPTVYDPLWQRFTNLTPAQITAFQGFPQDLSKYISQLRWQWETNGTSFDGPSVPFITLPAGGNYGGMQLLTDVISQQKIAALKQAIDNGTLATFPFPFIALNGIFQLNAADCTAVYGFVVRWVQQTYGIAATLLAGANATPQTVTNRAQVVAGFQAMKVQAQGV